MHIGNSPAYTVSQVFNVSTSAVYTLSWFDGTLRPTSTSPYSVAVLSASSGIIISNRFDASHSEVWRRNEIRFSLSQGDYKLEFRAQGNGNSHTTVLDNVILTEDLFKILDEPSDSQVPLGGRAVFRVIAANSAEVLGYQWLLNGAPIPRATSPELVIEGVRFTDEGDYSVIIETPNGTLESRVARLSVLESPLYIYPAVELEFPTELGKKYQVEGSHDLRIWVPIGPPIDGTGQLIRQLIPAREPRFKFYRLREVQ